MPFNTPKISPPSFGDPFVEDDGRLSSDAFNWFVITLLPAVEQVAAVFGASPPVETTGLTDAVALTDLPLGSLGTGIYRVSVYTRITSPAGVSSSVEPFVSFVDDGVTCTMTGTALTTNTINTPLGQTFLVSVDSPGPISYGTNYASNPANAATYKLTVTVERVQ